MLPAVDLRSERREVENRDLVCVIAKKSNANKKKKPSKTGVLRYEDETRVLAESKLD